MKIAIYTAISGGKDCLIEPQFTSDDIDYIAFTNETPSNTIWNIHPILQDQATHNLNSKQYKVFPHKFLPEGYDFSIWIDGNCLVKSDPRPLIKDNPLSVFYHCDGRQCAYQEAKAVKHIRIADPEVVDEQMGRYKIFGYPENHGLLSGGVIIRKHSNLAIQKLMELWWSEISRGSSRDQLSFNYCVWKLNLPVNYLDGNLRDNPYFAILPHKKNPT